MKRIYQANDLIQAQLVVNLLEQLMIPACVENVHQSGGLGELAVNYPEVWLQRTQDVARAQAAILRFENDKKKSQIQCRCIKCNELNPANFDFCWACQAAL